MGTGFLSQTWQASQRKACDSVRSTQSMAAGSGLNRFVVAALACLWVLSGSEPARAGAWLQQPAGWYANTTMLLFLSQEFYDLQGRRQPLGSSGEFEDFGVYFYLEYGLTNTLTFLASAPYKRLTYRSTTVFNRSSGVGDLYFGVKYGLATQPYVLSVQFGLKLAPGYEATPERLMGAPPLGDGQTDFDLRLLAGQSILSYRAYYSLDLGYRARAGAPVDEVLYSIEFGYNLSRPLLGMFKFYGVRALAEGVGLVDPGRRGEGSLISTGQVEDFAKGQVQLVYRASRLVQVSLLWEQILFGRNTAAGTTVGISLAFVRGN
jgi:hypothetical protein